jgi:hypothetical protein
MGPFFSYFGAKHRAAPRYPRPEHPLIVEPFAGAAGYATAYYRRNVILVEKNPIVAGIWRFLIGAKPKDILDIPLLKDGQRVPELDTHQAAKWLVGFWVNAAVPTPHHVLSTWGRLNPSRFWGATVRARIAAQVEGIKHWTLIEGSYQEAPNVPATWFVDPPYQVAGERYACSSKDIDFPALGAWCKSRKGLTMVCENEGADWLPFVPFFDMSGAGRENGTRKKSVEALWIQRTT